MKTIIEKLNTLEYRVRKIGNNKTDYTRRGKESYKKDLVEIPELIQELENDLRGSKGNEKTSITKNRLHSAKESFNYWS